MKKAFFISDTHLGAPYFPDSKERELRVVSFLESIREEASEIYLLGDILDYWYEYRYVVPRGFVRFFGKIAELADSGIKIVWLIGNHDIWIFDYIPSELGIKVIDGNYEAEILGCKMLLAHGDGIWQHSAKFKFLRYLFRNKICQRLFAGIHPRWTIAFANAWSRHSRINDSKCSSTYKNQDNPDEDPTTKNILKLLEFSKAFHDKHPDFRYFIFGHLHVVCREEVAENAEMLILGDWISKFSYAEFDGQNMKLKTYSSEI